MRRPAFVKKKEVNGQELSLEGPHVFDWGDSWSRRGLYPWGCKIVELIVAATFDEAYHSHPSAPWWSSMRIIYLAVMNVFAHVALIYLERQSISPVTLTPIIGLSRSCSLVSLLHFFHQSSPASIFLSSRTVLLPRVIRDVILLLEVIYLSRLF